MSEGERKAVRQKLALGMRFSPSNQCYRGVLCLPRRWPGGEPSSRPPPNSASALYLPVGFEGPVYGNATHISFPRSSAHSPRVVVKPSPSA